jgi:hypothetical protein
VVASDLVRSGWLTGKPEIVSMVFLVVKASVSVFDLSTRRACSALIKGIPADPPRCCPIFHSENPGR